MLLHIYAPKALNLPAAMSLGYLEGQKFLKQIAGFVIMPGISQFLRKEI
jgi:hypothetical protein